MEYLLPISSLHNITPHQREVFLDAIGKDKITGDHIKLSYTDRNYKCASHIDEVADSKVHAISFFSGCGGLDIGTQMGGAKIISTLDVEPATVETIRANPFFQFAEHRLGDVRLVRATDFSNVIKANNPEKLILVGGPPCQPFSKAGYWITNEKRKGINDKRNMVGEYLRLISEIKPDGFILENVESMLHPTNRPIVDYIESQIASMGYYFKRILANALEYGIPQKRKRVIFVASRSEIKGIPAKLSKEEVQAVNVLDWIARFDDDSYSESEESTAGKTYDFELSEVPPGHNYIALSARDGYPNPKFIANKRFWNFLLKLHPLLPSWTIAAQPGPWVGPFHWNNRRLRVREVAAIQTFPIDYQFVGTRRTIQKQIGNAVPCKLGEVFVKFLIDNL